MGRYDPTFLHIPNEIYEPTNPARSFLPWGMLRSVGCSLATLMLSGVCGLYLLYTRAFIYAGYIFVIPMSLVSSGR